MTPRELFQAGKLDEAVQALSAGLRENPTDLRRRTFLFELLCFAGEYGRAEKQLNILAQAGKEAEMGVMLYYSALHAERTRQNLFESREFSVSPASGRTIKGALDGKPFEKITDADPRVGPRLEVFAAGAYLWIPFEHITLIEIQCPARLRDLLWVPALVRTGPAFRGTELGEVLLPVLTPFAWRHSNDDVRLGRVTEWMEEENGEITPVGQKMFLVDGEEVPILEIRKLEFHAESATDQGAP